MLGTIFLWMFWPSFNGALAPEEMMSKHRVVTNTVLALCSSGIVSMALSMVIRGKFSMEDIQNATLAGGVAVGSSSDLVIGPWGGLFVGAIGGAVSVIGFIKVKPFLYARFGLHDTCGVLNLHGMPGMIGGIIGGISAASASGDI